MTETTNFGLDLGMGALKLHGNQQNVQLISQVAVNNGPLVGRMLGLGSSRLPLRITLPSGSTFFVDSGAHDSGRPVENLSMDRFAGSPEMLALFLVRVPGQAELIFADILEYLQNVPA